VDLARVSGPAEPEEPARKGNATSDDFRQAPLRDWDVVVRLELPRVAWLAQNHHAASQKLAGDHPEERKAADTLGHVVIFLEDERISRQE
jgi:hypothetical protein